VKPREKYSKQDVPPSGPDGPAVGTAEVASTEHRNAKGLNGVPNSALSQFLMSSEWRSKINEVQTMTILVSMSRNRPSLAASYTGQILIVHWTPPAMRFSISGRPGLFTLVNLVFAPPKLALNTSLLLS